MLLDGKILDVLVGCFHRDDKEEVKKGVDHLVHHEVSTIEPHDMGSHAAVKLIKPFSAESKVIQALAMVVSNASHDISELPGEREYDSRGEGFREHNWIRWA
jgi:hypothetical protein